MKQKFLIILSLLLMVVPAQAFISQPASWSVSSKKVKKNVYEIKATGTIESGWHIYDLEEYPDGPNPTVFTLSGDAIEALGEARITSKVSREFDKIFGMEIGTCESPVTIVQQVKALQDGPCDVKVLIEWQACNNGSCMPPDYYEASVEVVGKGTSETSGQGGSIWDFLFG